ncbi:D-glycerate dehydrogenase [Alkalihalobacillus sp. MEB130]|uniref:2-hydroxyacid dehydrogenase n=1 Tax=Alkalihalobacillus sp. MEB130 TaxID=2976704 RepID=UPI0028E09EE8|nr:D-glycerate dehydrogenase [Alkalihalobacillus sp. MEB130]MDT8863069.1 D-glycerate dehydrogenase [Alkalihalobacillus sp. MEB130]
MNKKPIVISYKQLPEEACRQIREHYDLVHIEKEKLENEPSSVSELAGAIGLMGAGLKVDSSFLEHAPSLKIVANISVGYNNLDLFEFTRRNILATNTPDVLTDTTADAIFGLLIATARRIPEMDRFVKNGEWSKSISPNYFGVDVHHKTLGIIGMGRIGKAIAKRASAGFDMNVLYFNRSRNQEVETTYQARYCSLEEVMRRSDFVCVMVPLTNETKNLISQKKLDFLQKHAILIVGSRGGVVDEEALVTALQEKKFRGAGLDVYEKEPLPKDHPLLTYKNVVTLPHIGSATEETRYQMAMLATRNLLEGLKTNQPPNLLNNEVNE